MGRVTPRSKRGGLSRDYNCDSTAIRLRRIARLLPFDVSKKLTSIFRRSRIVVESQYCDIGVTF